MSKVLDFTSHDEMSDLMIKIEQSDECKTTAKVLSEFILSLPISRMDNNKLVDLMVTQVRVSERNAFYQGAQWGALLEKVYEECSE